MKLSPALLGAQALPGSQSLARPFWRLVKNNVLPANGKRRGGRGSLRIARATCSTARSTLRAAGCAVSVFAPA